MPTGLTDPSGLVSDNGYGFWDRTGASLWWLVTGWWGTPDSAKPIPPERNAAPPQRQPADGWNGWDADPPTTGNRSEPIYGLEGNKRGGKGVGEAPGLVGKMGIVAGVTIITVGACTL